MALAYPMIALGLTIPLVSIATTAQAAIPAAPTIPTTIHQHGNQTATVPNWAKITFASLPRLPQSGSISLPDATPIRQWRSGQSIADVMTLGDFQDSFRLQNLNLFAIAAATDMVPEEVSLSQLKLLQRQTIRSLVAAIPAIAEVPINQIPPIANLIATTKLPPQLATLTLNQLLEQTPTLGDLRFEAIPLDQYHLTDIPNLLMAPLSKFENWQDAAISDIPNLAQLPWSELPNPPANDGMIAAVQANSSLKTTTSISGSDQAGYAVVCASKSCPNITFQNNTALDGKSWNAANSLVPGGQGDWKMINGGVEPTGRSIFTHAFKIAIVQTQPEIKTALFFKACRTDSGNALNCSPYAIGGIPLQTLHNGDAMLVGEIEVSVTEPALPELSDPATPPIVLPDQNAPTQSIEPRWKIWLREIEAWIESFQKSFPLK